jgi:Ca2+-binding EF-hand superfamily protein
MDDEMMADLLFQEIDVDGSGTLDREEVALCAKKLGAPLSEEALEAAMQTMDADGNGSVDFDEFFSAFARAAH